MREQREVGKVALVTGSTRGIGRATVLTLARAGFKVVVTGRTAHEGDGRDDSDTGKGTLKLPGSLESCAQEIEEAGGGAFAVRLDMLDRVSVRSAFESVIAHWGRVDALVNNAPHLPGTTTPLEHLDIATVDDSMQVNVINPLYLTLLCLRGMLNRGHGTIVNVSSPASFVDPPGIAGRGG